jgi:hypothetical protein
VPSIAAILLKPDRMKINAINTRPAKLKTGLDLFMTISFSAGYRGGLVVEKE